MSNEIPKIRVVMMPKDTNPYGIIFGGVLLSYIDQAGAIAAREHATAVVTDCYKRAKCAAEVGGKPTDFTCLEAYLGIKFVTVAMDGIKFREPVFVGDILSLHTEVVKTGRSSIVIKVTAVAVRSDDLMRQVTVTGATVTFVAVDDNRKPVNIFLNDD